MRNYETIYTVSSTDDLAMEPLDMLTVGSYRSRGRAIRECADYILDRMRTRSDVKYVILHDENHPEVRPQWSHRKLRDFLMDELGGASCYVAYTDGIGSFHFNIDENDLED